MIAMAGGDQCRLPDSCMTSCAYPSLHVGLEYKYYISKGEELVVPDALSRLYDEAEAVKAIGNSTPERV